MYNVEKLIEEGRKIMYKNPRRMITAHELVNQEEKSDGSLDFGNNMFLIGLAIGARIAKSQK